MFIFENLVGSNCELKSKSLKLHISQNNLQILNKLGSGCLAQLVEQLLPIPEVRSSNPVIGKNLFIFNICLLSTVY